MPCERLVRDSTGSDPSTRPVPSARGVSFGATGSILRRPTMSRVAPTTVIPVALLVAVALAMPGTIAAKDSLPERAVYTDPGPVPPPDTVAKEFVDRNAPSLGGVTTEQLARGVVVAEPATPGRPRPRPPEPPAAEPIVLERAGVTSERTPIDPLVGVVVAAFLAAFGVVILASAPQRARSGSGALP